MREKLWKGEGEGLPDSPSCPALKRTVIPREYAVRRMERMMENLRRSSVTALYITVIRWPRHFVLLEKTGKPSFNLSSRFMYLNMVLK